MFIKSLMFSAWCLTFASISTTTYADTSDNHLIEPFDWSSIKPSTHLVYHPCDGKFKCARLLLPLNWLNETDPRTVSIAIKKLPAVVPDNHPSFAGTLFTNPGGPGLSGVEFVSHMGPRLQITADKPGTRHHEILSFDPRGVGESRPRADCFPGDQLSRGAMLLEMRGTWGLDRSASSLAYTAAIRDNFGRRCKEADSGIDIMPHAGTASVARDMVEMLDKIDALRAKEASNAAQERPELKKRTEAPVPRLQYIGFSYGTVLGNYFASLFPGRVGRMILDGVIDADDFTNGPGWLTSLADTDKVFDNFFGGCFSAGPSICALCRKTDPSALDIKSRVWAFIKQLDELPLTARDSSGTDVVVTGSDIRKIIGLALYKPLESFKSLSMLLNLTMTGHTTAIADIVLLSNQAPPFREACASHASREVDDAVFAVLCGDGDDVTGKSLAWWNDYVSLQVNTSEVFGAYWSQIRFGCHGWPFRANWSFKGPFTTPRANAALVPDRPAAPILFLANRLDPVAPLTAASAMSARHPGSVVVVQETMGHTALGSARSKCIDDIVATYLDTGELPVRNTSCMTDCDPWDKQCRHARTDDGWNQKSNGAFSFGAKGFPLGLE